MHYILDTKSHSWWCNVIITVNAHSLNNEILPVASTVNSSWCVMLRLLM